MSRFTHSVCAQCWTERHPDRPARGGEGNGDDISCCYCGRLTSDGIYVRDEPMNTSCDSANDRDHLPRVAKEE